MSPHVEASMLPGLRLKPRSAPELSERVVRPELFDCHPVTQAEQALRYRIKRETYRTRTKRKRFFCGACRPAGETSAYSQSSIVLHTQDKAGERQDYGPTHSDSGCT